MKNPLISIIVPVYKVERYLPACVESVLSQSYKTWELILVDDGSPDNCPKICDDFSRADQRIKVIHKPNGGPSSARNAGLDIAKGDFFTFLDSDDFWHKEYLSIMLDLCLKYNADIAQCGFVRGSATNFPEINKKNNIKVFDNHSVFLSGYAKIIVWAKLYKRYLLNEVRMPVGKFFEDDFTTWKWYFKANRIIVTNHPLYYYTENNQSTMAGHKQKPRLDFIEAYEERIDFFKSNGKKDLEDFSRSHFCKALLLTSNNPRLSSEQKKIVDSMFLLNWQRINFSENVPFTLKFLFFLFRIMPKTTLRLVNLLR